jgi:hypothetical protein
MAPNTAIWGYLLYRTGDRRAIRNAYERAVDAHEKFERSTVFIEQINVGSVQFKCKELSAQQMAGMVPENKRFECGSCRLDLNDAPLGRIYITNHDFDPREGVKNHYSKDVKEIIEVAKTLYLATGVSPLAAHVAPAWLDNHIHREDAPPFIAESLANDRYEYLSWLTVFSPPVVETYGRETLLEAPAYHVEELADGSILVVVTKDPSVPEAYDESIADHIGIESY